MKAARIDFNRERRKLPYGVHCMRFFPGMRFLIVVFGWTMFDHVLYPVTVGSGSAKRQHYADINS